MQQLKSKIKPPFLLDGIQVARKRKQLDYKPERDSHLEQYFYNLHMRQMVSKLKAEQSSRRSLSQSKSKSFDKTIQSKTNLNQSSSPNRSAIKLPSQEPIPRQMSKENFITFLDSLITTVQNVQQLVITYFPKEEIDDKILQQQKELSKINNATEQLTKKLRATSLVENEKTQKNFTKLPQLNKKVVTYAKSKTERAHNTSYRKTPKLIRPQNTLPKNNQNSQEYENPGFEPYESIHEQSTKKSVEQQSNPTVDISKQTKSGQTTQLPSVRGPSQKKYQKEIQLILTKPKQYSNSTCITQQSPDQFKSKSVGNRDILPRSQSKQIPKFDIKQSIGFKKTESNKSKVQINKTIPIQIKINHVDQQEESTQQNRKPAVEIVEDVVQNFSNESEIFPTQVITDQDAPKNDQKLEGTACFKIQEEDEKRETIGRMSESNELPKLQQEADKGFFQMIKTQADKNDEIMLQQQETVKNSLQEENSVDQNEFNFKVVQSIEPKNDDFVVNPLEDSSEDQKLQTLEPKQVEDQYKQEFEQED